MEWCRRDKTTTLCKHAGNIVVGLIVILVGNVIVSFKSVSSKCWPGCHCHAGDVTGIFFFFFKQPIKLLLLPLAIWMTRAGADFPHLDVDCPLLP